MPINNPEELRAHLDLAIQIELSTIPPYLFAMYSIEDRESEPALLLRSIVAEEMLHVALATNLLLSVGGSPDFTSKRYIPRYPMELPHHKPPLLIELAPCSLDLIRNVFMKIEQPETHGAPAQADAFETLGQFYHALEIGLDEVARSHPIFSDPQLSAQMADPGWYRPVAFDADDSGGLVAIRDLDSALEAIEIIVHQGEGLSDERWADVSHQELTHFHKLQRLTDQEIPLGAVRPLRPNPSTSAFPAGVREVSDLFNACYRYVFLLLGEIFSDRTERGALVGVLYDLMKTALSDLAHHLVDQTLSDGDRAAPTFEAFDFSPDPSKDLASLCESVALGHPELETVCRWISEAVDRVEPAIGARPQPVSQVQSGPTSTSAWDGPGEPGS